MDRWREATVTRVTVICLAGGFALIGLGTAGLASSPLVVALLLVASGALYALGRGLEGSAVERVDRHRMHADLWIGPLVGAVVALGWLHATPGELQALGGLVGLVGMANYFLRPVYHLLWGLGRRAAALVG